MKTLKEELFELPDCVLKFIACQVFEHNLVVTEYAGLQQLLDELQKRHDELIHGRQSNITTTIWRCQEQRKLVEARVFYLPEHLPAINDGTDVGSV